MKLYTFRHQNQVKVGVQVGSNLAVLPYPDMISLIESGDGWRGHVPDSGGIPLDQVQILSPIPKPGKVFCSGLNYKSHVTENPDAVFLDDPRFFSKTENTFVGPGDPILHPGEEFQVDYEVELAVVIGKPMLRPQQSHVMDHIFGYTILHDVSARAVQFKDKNEDMGKNFDSFCPIGPCIVTADEIPHPERLRLKTEINGVTLQDGTNEDWCFSLPRLLAWLSMGMTLKPGDIVSTGTPAGIGFFRNPQIFLKPGDVCRLTIDPIGTLENPVVAIPEGAHLEWNIDRS